MAEKLEELKQSLLEQDVELEVKLNPNIHDREIRLDNGWVIKIGRGWTSTRSLAVGSRWGRTT
jgi:ATP-dependent Lon protease